MTSTTTLSKKAIRKAKVSSTAKSAAEVTSASDDAIVVQAKSKEPKKSKTNSIEIKIIDALKNTATSVIFMNLFTFHCTQNGVDPTLKTIMDNGATSNELLQLLQPTHNESVKNNDKIEGGESKSKILNKNYKISQYHHLEDYDYPVNKDSLYTLNSFYNQNIVTQLHQQSQQQDVHKNSNKLKEYVKDLYGIKLVPDTTVPIPKAVESEMKYKPQKIEFNTPTDLTNIDDKNYTVNIFNHPKRLNSNKELINDEEYELLYTVKFDKETNYPIISLLHSTGTSDTSLIPTLKCLMVPNKENMDKPKIIINSHSKEEQFKLIIDTGSNVSIINKRLISKEMRNHVHKTKSKINFPLLDVKE
ncbi:hypothetical protein ACTFIW_000970 [Dictyostelium discoideum]